MNVGALSIPASIGYADIRIWKTPARPLVLASAFSVPNPAGYTTAFVEPILTCVTADGGFVPGDEVHPVYGDAVSTSNGVCVGWSADAITVAIGTNISLPSPKAAPTTNTTITAARWSIRAVIGGSAQSGALSIPFASQYLQAFRTGELPYSASQANMSFGNGPGRRPLVVNALGRCLSTDAGYQVGDIVNLNGLSTGGNREMCIAAGGDTLNLVYFGAPLVVTAGGGANASLTAGKWNFFLTGLA